MELVRCLELGFLVAERNQVASGIGRLVLAVSVLVVLGGPQVSEFSVVLVQLDVVVPEPGW
jgi:hypothetical protein